MATGTSWQGIFGKVGRAAVHIEHLSQLEADVAGACQTQLAREIDQARSEVVFRLKRVPDVPDDFCLVLGDAIHNLRAALDYLANALVAPSARHDRTQFPILLKRRANGALPDIAPGVALPVRQALDLLQPYQFDHPHIHDLAILHKLDIIDKHRQLLVHVVGATGMSWAGEAEVVAFLTGPYGPGGDPEVCRVRTDDPGGLRADVHFGVCVDEQDASVARPTSIVRYLAGLKDRIMEKVILGPLAEFVE